MRVLYVVRTCGQWLECFVLLQASSSAKQVAMTLQVGVCSAHGVLAEALRDDGCVVKSASKAGQYVGVHMAQVGTHPVQLVGLNGWLHAAWAARAAAASCACGLRFECVEVCRSRVR